MTTARYNNNNTYIIATDSVVIWATKDRRNIDTIAFTTNKLPNSQATKHTAVYPKRCVTLGFPWRVMTVSHCTQKHCAMQKAAVWKHNASPAAAKGSDETWFQHSSIFTEIELHIDCAALGGELHNYSSNGWHVTAQVRCSDLKLWLHVQMLLKLGRVHSGSNSLPFIFYFASSVASLSYIYSSILHSLPLFFPLLFLFLSF
jgi:hypothetical protein